MHQLKDKKYKITLYLIFFLILSTNSGKYLEKEIFFFKNNKIKVDVKGLSVSENLEILNELNDIQSQSIFDVDKEEIKKIIEKYNIIEEYNIKKIYPSIIKINIKPTKFIARISDKQQLLVGSNGKLSKKK